MNIVNIETRFRVLFYGFRIVSMFTYILQGTYVKNTTVLRNRIYYTYNRLKGENDTDPNFRMRDGTHSHALLILTLCSDKQVSSILSNT